MLAADWSTLRNKGPYSLLFLDPSVPEDASVDAVADLVEPGGRQAGGQMRPRLVKRA